MLQQMTSRQFSEWMAYYQIEPFGPHLDNWRTGQQCSVVANCNRDTKTKKDPYVPSDFMPGKKKVESLADQIRAAFTKLPRK